MTSETPDLCELARRLEAVERQNRRMGLVGITALVGLAVALLVTQGQPPKRVVEAEQFIVRDARGKRRALLGLDHPTAPDHSPVRVGLYNEDEKSSAVLYLSDGFAGLSIIGDGEPGRTVQLYANPKEGAGIRMGTGARKTAARLSASPDGSARFTLEDESGSVVFTAP